MKPRPLDCPAPRVLLAVPSGALAAPSIALQQARFELGRLGVSE